MTVIIIKTGGASQLTISPRTNRICALVDDTFHRDRRGFATADAKRGNPTAQVARLERVQQGYNQPCACSSDRVPEGARAAIYVQLVPRNAKVPRRRHRNDRKGLVDLEQVDVTYRPTNL